MLMQNSLGQYSPPTHRTSYSEKVRLPGLLAWASSIWYMWSLSWFSPLTCRKGAHGQETGATFEI